MELLLDKVSQFVSIVVNTFTRRAGDQDAVPSLKQDQSSVAWHHGLAHAWGAHK